MNLAIIYQAEGIASTKVLRPEKASCVQDTKRRSVWLDFSVAERVVRDNAGKKDRIRVVLNSEVKGKICRFSSKTRRNHLQVLMGGNETICFMT